MREAPLAPASGVAPAGSWSDPLRDRLAATLRAHAAPFPVERSTRRAAGAAAS